MVSHNSFGQQVDVESKKYELLPSAGFPPQADRSIPAYEKMKIVPQIIATLVLMGCNQVQTNDKEIINDSEEITLSEISELLKPRKQTFAWSAKKDTLISCEKGTKIYLPNNCLDPNTYDASKPVSIEVKECYKLSEFISEGLSTMTQNKILETGGMVNIEVKQGDKSVQLKKGSEYGLLFPKDPKSNEMMQTFLGNINADAQIIWELDGVVTNQTTSTNPITPAILTECEFNLYAYTSGFDGDSDIDWVVSTTNEHVPLYIENNLNPTKKQVDQFCESQSFARYDFWYDPDGSIKKIGVKQSVSAEFDSLLTQFVRNMPPIKVTPITKKYIDRSYSIEFNAYRVSKYDKDQYAANFKEKYASIKDQIVTKVDKAELNYYVLAASKFGWINCDRFWETEDEKIDYLVEVQNMDDVNLSLVFSDINSILPATKVGNNYVFRNVPVGREVKLIGIGHKGESTTLAVNKTKITKKRFQLSGFKSFKLVELEKELNSI